MAVVAYLHLKYTPEAKEKVLKLIQDAVGIARDQEGFQDLNAYHCLEASAWHVFITWESQAHHDACQNSPQWLMLMPVLSELMEAEALELKLTFCEAL
jgi:heme-degrading monooxygenase HmoA